MEMNDKYNLGNQPDLENAGFQNVSAHDLECQKLFNEYRSYSHLSTYGFMVSALFFGIHRFRTGKIFTGLLYLFTGGGFAIWTIIDMLSIAAGKWKDKDGRPINIVKAKTLRMQLVALDSKYEKMLPNSF